jgi:hypothetical protein
MTISAVMPCAADINQSTVKTWEFLTPPPRQLMPNRPPLSPAIPRESFLAKSATQSSADFDFDPRKLLRRRSSLVIADLPTREHMSNSLAESKGTLEEASSEDDEEDEKEKRTPKSDGKPDEKEKKPEDKKKPPPTQFNEPDANSLLDAFGF